MLAKKRGGPEIVRVHLFISGIVQGVFFRAHTRNRARSLDLTGWVKNMEDGRVEVIAEGLRGMIDEFISWCHRGPEAASVHGIEVIWQQATGEFRDFQVHY